MKRTAALRILFGADTKQFDAALQQSVRKMQRTAKDLQTVGRNLSRNLTAPLVGIAAVSVKTAADFEFAMAKVQAVSGFTATEMAGLRKQAESLGASTSKTQDEVASLQYELAKLGKTSPEIGNMTESILSLGIAFDQDLGQTAEIVGATLNQFELDASQTARVADNMAVLFGTSALDLERFGSAMEKLGPVANGMGISLEEVSGAMALLVNSGVDASTVGTSLTKALSTLAKKGLEGSDALDALSTGNFTIAEAFEIFGDRAGKIIPILNQSKGKIDAYVEAQKNGTGAAVKARKVLEDTAQGGFDKLKSAASAAATALGKELLPFVNSMVTKITDLFTAFTELSGGTKKFIVIVGALLAGIGPVVFMMGQFLFALSQIKMALKAVTIAQLKTNLAVLANPYVLAAAAIGAMAYALYNLTKRTRDQNIAQTTLNNNTLQAEKRIADETTKMRLLVSVANDANIEEERRLKAIDDLRKIAPEYLGGLTLENISTAEGVGMLEAYNNELLRKAKIQAAEDRLVEIQGQLLDIYKETAAQGSISGFTVGEFMTAVFTGGWDKSTKQFIDRMGTVKADLLAEQQALLDIVKQNSTVQDDLTDGVTDLEAAYEEMRKKYEALLQGGDGTIKKPATQDEVADMFNVQSDLDKVLASLVLAEAAAEGVFELDGNEPAKFKALAEAYRQAAEESAALGEIGMAEELNAQAEAYKLKSMTVSEFLETLENTPVAQFRTHISAAQIAMEALTTTAEQLGSIIGSAFAAMISGAKKGKDAMKEMAKALISTALAASQAGIIEAMINSGKFTGPAAPIVIPALVASGIALVQGLFANIPAFAQGGLVTGPTLSLLGDNRSGKEAVIPFERMGEFLSKFGGGTNDVNVHGVIQGRNLLLVQERGLRNQSRYR